MVSEKCDENNCNEEARVFLHPGNYCLIHNPYNPDNKRKSDELKENVRRVTGGITKKHYNQYYEKLEIENKKKAKAEEEAEQKRVKEQENKLKKDAERIILKEREEQIFLSTSSFNQVNLQTVVVYYLYPYYPTSREGAWDINSNKILEVKKKKKEVIDEMINILNKNLKFQGVYTIVVVPSHDVMLNDSGIKRIAKSLCKNNYLDGTDCIKRKYTIPEQHNSAKRMSADKLKESLKIENESLIKDKDILLFDDITTSGASIESATELLKENGAKSITAIVLGRTS